MKRALLIIVLLVAWWSGTALADYDARKSEAISELEKATLTNEERAALKKSLETYFGGREDCFEGLVAIVAKTDDSAQHPTFRDRVGVCGVGASQVLSRALSDIKEPSKGALDFVNVFSGAEAAFYESLRAVLVAEARDLIVVIRLNLIDMTEALDEKWKTILDEDESLDERAKRLAGEIRTDLDEVIKQAAETDLDAAEALAEGIKKWAQAGPVPKAGDQDIDTAISLVVGALAVGIEYWQNRWNTRTQTRIGVYRTLFTSERRVLIMFEDVRDDVKEFLEKNDFPFAEAGFAKAKSSIDTFVSNAKTSGQSSDASELRDDLMAPLTGHLKAAADVYSTFVGRHKEKFFGALAPNIEQELIEHAAWEGYADALEGYSLDAKLRTWQDHANDYFGVDLSPLSTEARERLKAGLRASIDQLVNQLKESGKTYRDVKVVIEDEREDVEEEMD